MVRNYEMYRATTTAAIREPNVAPINTPEDCPEDGKLIKSHFKVYAHGPNFPLSSLSFVLL